MDEKMKKALNESLVGLAKYPKRPTQKLWNKTAKEQGYLSSITIMLITGFKWKELYAYVKR